MEIEEAEFICARVNAAWMSDRAMPDSLAIEWQNRMVKLPFAHVNATIEALIETCKKRPSFAEFYEQFRALAPKFANYRALAKPHCGMCDDGWIPVRCNTASHDCDCGDAFHAAGDRCPRGGVQTVARCPSGCQPRTPAEREEFYRAEQAKVRRERRAPRLDVSAAAKRVDDLEDVF